MFFLLKILLNGKNMKQYKNGQEINAISKEYLVDCSRSLL